MSEEKKEEQRESAPKEEKRPAEKEMTQKEGGQKEPSAQQKSEKPKNCVRCNKPVKRKTWYYRNGKFYCGKGCWKLSQQKEKVA